MSTVKSTDVKDNFKEYKVIQKEKTFSTKKERNSGIELLKIIAIVLIVISHVVYTLKTVNPYISYNGYVVDFIDCNSRYMEIYTCYFFIFWCVRKFYFLYMFCMVFVAFFKV